MGLITGHSCAGIYFHHLPKPPRSKGRSRPVEQAMYAGIGASEWTNTPRSTITIENTLNPKVFVCILGKGKDAAGWEPDKEGNYIRYYAHASKGEDWRWYPATDSQIISAILGINMGEFGWVFPSDEPLTFGEIREGLKAAGHDKTDEEIEQMLEEAVARGELINLVDEEKGETVWKHCVVTVENSLAVS